MNWSALRRFGTTFLLGIAIGAAVTVPYYGHKVESLQLTHGQLLQQLHEHRSRLRKLNEASQNPRDRLVRDVTLSILWHDEAVRLALNESLSPLSNELVGRELERIDPYLVFAIFDGRTVQVEERLYRLTVRSLIIAEQLSLVLTVELLPPPRSGVLTF